MMRLLSVTLFLSFFIPGLVSAQAIDDFSMRSNPTYPKAGQLTTISIESFSFDLNRSTTIWKENGVVVAKEIGLTQKDFVSPQNGASKTISIEVETPSGFRLSKTYTLAPQAVDMLWEAVDSYTPPFYKGKAMPGEQSLVRVVAIPNFTSKGAPLDRSQTVYTWSIDGKRSEQGSGYNKSSVVFKFNPLKSGATIKLNAGTLGGSENVEETLSLRPSPTEILFYEINPALGILLERVFLGGMRLVTNEVSILAAPLNMSNAGQQGSVGYTWSLNGSPVSVGGDGTIITLTSPEKAGRATLGVGVQHIEKTLQNIRSTLEIVYDK